MINMNNKNIMNIMTTGTVEPRDNIVVKRKKKNFSSFFGVWPRQREIYQQPIEMCTTSVENVYNISCRKCKTSL